MLVRACTWNVNHHSGAFDVAPTIGETVQRGVDLWLLQEVKARSGIVPMLREKYDLGVRHAEPEFAIAWDRQRFAYERHARVLMSPIRYWTINYALVVVLRDLETGRRLKTMSYHPPAHVQAPRHKTHDKVWEVLHDVVETWNEKARGAAPRTACLFGGDDNVDEKKGWSPRGGWDFMLHGPLTQVCAPKPTRGGRRIDDFRTNMRPVGSGLVLETPRKNQDHRPFIHNFAYTAKETP